MKKQILTRLGIGLVLAIMSSGLVSCCSKRGLINTSLIKDSVIDLAPVLQQVKSQYDLAEQYLKQSNIQITEVDAIFDVSNSAAIDGNLSLWVVKADYKRTTAGETTVTFTLSDTTSDKPKPFVHAIDPSNKLSALIVNTVKDFLKVKQITIGPLTAQTFEIDVNYSVDSDGTIDVSPKVGNLGIDGSYERDHKVTQTLQLKFKVKKS